MSNFVADSAKGTERYTKVHDATNLCYTLCYTLSLKCVTLFSLPLFMTPNAYIVAHDIRVECLHSAKTQHFSVGCIGGWKRLSFVV